MKFEVRSLKEYDGRKFELGSLKLEVLECDLKSDLPERTFAFAERIVRLCVYLEQNGRVSTTLATQLLRSGTSVGANVEEAGSAESRKDFVHKYAIACKEARESHYWLRLLSVSEVVPRDRLDPLTSEANELIAILTTIIKKSRE